MAPRPMVLVLGGTGRTGRRVVEQLLTRGLRLRTIVRSAERLPAEYAGHRGLEIVVAELLSLNGGEMRRQVQDCDAVVSCLGHATDPAGVFAAPRDLVAQATERICRAAEWRSAATPMRFVLMSSVAVNDPGGSERRRRPVERGVLWALRALLPPARDNQNAADFLVHDLGATSRYTQWVIVRPDALIEGEVCNYAVYPGLVSSLFKPDQTTIANVAHFMAELVCDLSLWREWNGRLPVVVDARGESPHAAPRDTRGAAGGEDGSVQQGAS